MDVTTLLDAPVSRLPGVSRRAATTLRTALGITTIRDLLEHYPHQDRYRDVGAQVPLSEAPLGEAVTIVGDIGRWHVSRPRRNMRIANALLLAEGGGRVEVPFFNQEWRARATPAGTRVAVSGTLERFRSKLQLRNAKIVELAAGEQPGDTDRIVATYPAIEALSSTRIAGFVRTALEALPPLPDFLPGPLRERHRLLDLDTAVRTIHRPPDLKAARPARTRLVYDELLCLQIGLQQRRRRLEEDSVGLGNGPAPDALSSRFLQGLAFDPTGAQHGAMDEIGEDLARPKPMHRLLQGDVGSGKTLVAAWSMLCALDRGRQAVLMAPTEVLAEQHLRTLTSLLAPLGVNVLDGPRLELLTGSTPLARRRGLLAQLAVGDVRMLVGTHALLEDRVAFHDLGVVVVDEQHRFGVEHRTRLRDKRADGRTPDVLVMTATPIPRSLALTLYGDLDVTVLDELPPGRQEIVTQVIGSDSPRRKGLYDFIRQRVAAGERAYVVTPLVEPSEALRERSADSRDVAAAEQVYRQLTSEVFSDLEVGLVHGRLGSAERDRVMERFRAGEVQILVATTVIEVGVDVPEATVMVIEDADRFGISQLHQLRGRVGRGSARSYCVLFSADSEGNERLAALAATTDGFVLAERDLELRGEGSLFDTRQSGLPDLKLAKLARDQQLVAATRRDARRLVEADPEMLEHPLLAAEVRRRYGEERLEALRTG
ncbi:MAG: ATP-dependent DNA helicase RecG [Nitriliruptorales bacterium]|nr:ATP-dependent DNA helicase RecG [Nitriliruptorales bacterium]